MIVQKINRAQVVTRELDQGAMNCVTSIGDVIYEKDTYAIATRTCRVIITDAELDELIAHRKQMKRMREKLNATSTKRR